MSNYKPTYELLEARLAAVGPVLNAVAGVFANVRWFGGIGMYAGRVALFDKAAYDELERIYAALVKASHEEALRINGGDGNDHNL